MAVNYADKIAKCEEAIAKKQNLITKREKQMEKAKGELNPLLESIGCPQVVWLNKEETDRVDAFIRNELLTKHPDKGYYEVYPLGDIREILSNVHEYQYSIKEAQGVIEDKQKALAKYRAQVEKEQNKDLLIEQMPAVFREFRNELLTNWDEFDIRNRPVIEKIYSWYNRAKSTISSRLVYVPYQYSSWRNLTDEQKAKQDEAVKKNRPFNRMLRYLESLYKPYAHLVYLIGLTDSEIHEKNVEATRALILELYERVIRYTGPITDAFNLKVTRGNDGFATINGYVKGENGTAKVESHGCAGYNIVRYYVRTNVYPVH